MENRVRDLEQLQESDHERKWGSLVMAAFAILALAFAIGLVVGKAALPGAPERDPLDQLDRVAEATRREAATSPQPAAAKPEPTGDKSVGATASPAIEPTQLTFERSLTDVEERPEVIAALEAAGREEERLAIHTAAPAARAPEESDEYDLGGLEADEEPAALGGAEPKAVPAGVAAGAGQKLEKAKAHDKLIAAALPKNAGKGRPAARGSEGEFTLQVISYDSQPAAEAFASALRARGHEAFVTTGEVEGRGRYYRVRVGPFKTKESAEAYRRAFEERERMNTIVVKRPQVKN